MRKFLILIGLTALVLSFGSCVSRKFETRDINMIFTVDTIIGDTAILTTKTFKRPYHVESRNRYIGEEKFFMLWVYGQSHLPGEFNAKIRKEFDLTDTLGIRRAMRIESYMRLTDKK